MGYVFGVFCMFAGFYLMVTRTKEKTGCGCLSWLIALAVAGVILARVFF